jgi:hypothetical protein
MDNFWKRVQAIKELYPNVTSNQEDVSYDDELNVVTVDETAIANKITEMDADRETEKQAKINAKVSGNQKLLDLGLTQAEATALTGYTPPTEV